jgi:hypothetical protein
LNKRIIFLFFGCILLSATVSFADDPSTAGLPKICSASSQDGLHWKHNKLVCVAKASNPCAVVKGGVIYLYFIDAKHTLLQRDTIECAVSKDGANFQKKFLIIAGIPTYKAADPSVVVDSQGIFRLYYVARDPIIESSRKKEIHVAESSDGVFFEEKRIVFSGPGLSNPEVICFKDKWYLYYIDKRNKVAVAISDDGYEFKPMAELAFRATSKPLLLADGRLRFYTFIPGPGCRIMRSFFSQDGLSWELEAENRLEALPDEEMWEISVIPWQNGYKMFFRSLKR